MKILASNEDGMTTRDLRNLLRQLIDIDESGNESTIFAAVGNLHMSVVTTIAKDDDGDLVLISGFAEDLMKDLGSWDDFIQG